jgi:hypothetical protein
VPGPTGPAGAVAHCGALCPRSQSTVCVIAVRAGTRSRIGVPGRGQSCEDQIWSPLSLLIFSRCPRRSGR